MGVMAGQSEQWPETWQKKVELGIGSRASHKQGKQLYQVHGAGNANSTESNRSVVGGATFGGVWQDGDGTLITIKGNVMRGPDGMLELSMISNNTFAIRVGSEEVKVEATTDGRLLWSDGDIWFRAQEERRPANRGKDDSKLKSLRAP